MPVPPGWSETIVMGHLYPFVVCIGDLSYRAAKVITVANRNGDGERDTEPDG